MFDYRRIALWVAMLVVPGGIFLLPLILADLRKQRNAKKAASAVPEDNPKTPNDGPGSTPTPRTPHDGTTPRMAA
jgi:hypothetical protein